MPEEILKNARERERKARLEAERLLELKSRELYLVNKNLQENLDRLARRSDSLEKANEELKLAQSQIIQSSKLATIGQLAAGVAHEINNPLAFVASNSKSLEKYFKKILDFIGMLSERIDNDNYAELKKSNNVDFIIFDIEELLADNQEGLTRVRDIIADLKTFSRVDQAEMEKANLNDCIETTLKIAWNEIKYKVKLIKELSDIPSITCNVGQINQVLMNLIVNAAQAIETEGEVTITTRVENSDIVLVIKDTGCGISPEDMEKIYDPFFTTKPVGMGTGLGLSITYGIIKDHDGTIELESEEGKGTAFTIRLPISP